LTPAQLDRLLYFLGWQIRARLRSGKYAIPNLTEAEVEPMNQALKACFSDRPANWADLQAEWMTRLAARSGCRHWGYKMPQAFRHLEHLFGHYPNLRVIFLMRSPQNVLASYKYMRPGAQDGDPAQYHPIAHALYWRQAARAYLEARTRFGERVILLRFEDLVADPADTARHIARFLGAAEPGGVIAPPQPNTSFESDRRRLNGLELFFLTRIAGRQRAQLGFEPASGRIRAADFIELLQVTWTFTGFRLKKALGALRQRRGRTD